MKGQYRHLTLRHEQRLLNNEIPPLKPGEAKFHSYYLPSLQAAEHTITVKQNVEATLPGPKGEKKSLDADAVTRKFKVLAPRYSVTDDAVATTYPASGHTAQFRTMPHMVFRDPHFPWERPGATQKNNEKDSKNMIPWVALVAFTAEELQLDKATKEKILPLPDAKLNENLSFDIPVKEIESLPKDKGATILVADPEDREKETERTSVVAIQSTLFRDLFVDNTSKQVDVSRYRFLSHVRSVSTEGMLSAIDGDSGTFSIVLSHRLGPLETQTPTPVAVHLLSLDGLDGYDASGLQDRVIMTSLYSWTYTALPPKSFDVVSAMKNLGTKEHLDAGSLLGGLTILKTGRTTPPPPPAPSPPGEATARPDMNQLITERQQQGFTITRHRTVTGELTAAMYRGPLVPTEVPHPLRPEMKIQSNFGTDLQILDADFGLMDISYASAWQLGRTLAMSDPSFTTALARLRGVMHRGALDRGKQNIHAKLEAYSGPHKNVVHRAVDSVQGLNAINDLLHQTTQTAISTNRWKRERVPKVDISLYGEHMYHQMSVEAGKEARISSRAMNSDEPYNFHVVPTNTDYAVVQEWVLDKLHLSGIPAHYLIPDPSYLPPETLRFFHVDENWTESLVDGALSMANHVTSKAEEDFCRTALKDQLKDYFAKPLPKLGYCQQMPKYGFLLRSQVLVQFPDLTISAKFKKQAGVSEGTDDDGKIKPQAPILVQRLLETDIMLVLFDRAPPDLASLEFTLPPHQQTFVVASGLNDKKITIAHSRIYACKKGTELPPSEERREKLGEDMVYDTNTLFDWESRTIKVEEYARTVYQYLKRNMPTPDDYFIEEGATSAILALQLNEPIHTLRIMTEAEIRTAHEPDKPAFTFNAPEFPAHKFKAMSALPPPVTNALHPLGSLDRQTIPSVEPLAGPFIQPELLALLARGPLPSGCTIPGMPTRLVDKGRPQFLVRIYPFDRDDFIPTLGEVSPDLIVSVVLPKMPSFSYIIKQIVIKIPLGDLKDPELQPPKLKPGDKKTKRPLANLYSGQDAPLPTMLSNLHFDVLRRFDIAQKQMVLAVVARSRKGVNLRTLEEASFLLPRVDLIRWEVPGGGTYTANVHVDASYIMPDKQEKTFSDDYDIYMGQPLPEDKK